MLLVNDEKISVTIFPDRTSQVWHLPKHIYFAHDAKVTWIFESEAELIHLAQLKSLLGARCTLELPYLPYGRQDKQNGNNEQTFALRIFARIINEMYFDRVVITDPHSTVALETINNSVAIYPIQQVIQVAERMSSDLICYPDKGALNKYTSEYHGILPFIYGEKVRDQATGNITSYQVVGNPAGKNVLIVDDICDGGATFKILAKDLLACGAKSVVLFVTHGIFSRGLQTLRDSGIQRIFTKDGEASEDEGSIMYRRLS